MEINLNPGFFLPASEYFRRHKDVQKRHSGSLSPLLEALQIVFFVLLFFDIENINNLSEGLSWLVDRKVLKIALVLN